MSDKLLLAKGNELSRLLGEVLEPDIKFCMCYERDNGVKVCSVCDEPMDKLCHHPISHIRLDDWNVTMKWRDWAESKFKPSDFEDAMYSVYNSTKYHDVMSYSMWLLRKALPKHFLIAVAICKLNVESEAKKD